GHAVFQIQGGICQVTDNHSSNGTWVNGIRLAPGKPVEIVNDDRIRLADEDFTLEIQ
ncbi:MAG: FHA domain-containing protein, partial [Lachnospiraceae bacterium]|nr:FHA domain-containing protein [Lachnospiraceae bacterium]